MQLRTARASDDDGHYRATPREDGAENWTLATVQRGPARRQQLRVRDLHAQGTLRTSAGEGLQDGGGGRHYRTGRRRHHAPGGSGTETRPDPGLRSRPAYPPLQGLDVRNRGAGERLILRTLPTRR